MNIDSIESVPVERLKSFGLWRPYLRTLALEKASAGVELTPEQAQEAWLMFCKKQGVDPASGAAPKAYPGLSPEELRRVAEYEMRVALWRKAEFGPRIRDYFLQRKPHLDRVVYSMLRVEDAALARELYFRLREGEATFAELAGEFTRGHEIHTGGQIGPVALGSLAPALAAKLAAAKPGQLLAPGRIGEWHLVLRLDRVLPVELDDAMSHQMADELLARWLEQQIDVKATH